MNDLLNVPIYDADAAEAQAEESRCHYCGEYGIVAPRGAGRAPILQHPNKCKTCGHQPADYFIIVRVHLVLPPVILPDEGAVKEWLDERDYDDWLFDSENFEATSSVHCGHVRVHPVIKS